MENTCISTERENERGRERDREKRERTRKKRELSRRNREGHAAYLSGLWAARMPQT